MTSDASLLQDTAPIRAGEELDAMALEAYLRERLADVRPDVRLSDSRLQIEQFPGGHSNLTYLIRMGGSEFVLRRPPFGPVAPTAHDMPREYRLLAAIHPLFDLAPQPYLLCENTAIIGVPRNFGASGISASSDFLPPSLLTKPTSTAPDWPPRRNVTP